MKITWTKPALADLEILGAYLSSFSSLAAERVVGRIAEAVRQLEQFPLSGREGRIANSRELVVARTDYIVPYRILADRIEILAVVHAAREWPEHL